MELSSCFHPLYMGLLGGWAQGREHGYQLVDKNDNLPQRRTKSQSVRRDWSQYPSTSKEIRKLPLWKTAGTWTEFGHAFFFNS